MLTSKYPEINETAAASAVCYIKGKGKWWLQAEVFNCNMEVSLAGLWCPFRVAKGYMDNKGHCFVLSRAGMCPPQT